MTFLIQVSGVVAALAVLAAFQSAFTVPTGWVGIQYLFGRLQPTVYPPGLHISTPLHRHALVEIRPQTDIVEDVMCGTKDGVGLRFERIEVGNTLPREHVINVVDRFGEGYDGYLVREKIRHQIHVICSSLTLQQVFIDEFDAIDDRLLEFLRQTNKELESHLIIDFVRLSKPVLPTQVRVSYEKLAEERIARQVEHETQAKLLKQAETRHLVSTKEAELDLMMLKKQMERKQAEHEALLDRQRADIKADHEKRMLAAKAEAERQAFAAEVLVTQAKAKNEADKLLAEGLRALHSVPGFVELETARTVAAALGNNTKFFFGEAHTLPKFLPAKLIDGAAP